MEVARSAVAGWAVASLVVGTVVAGCGDNEKDKNKASS